MQEKTSGKKRDAEIASSKTLAAAILLTVMVLTFIGIFAYVATLLWDMWIHMS